MEWKPSGRLRLQLRGYLAPVWKLEPVKGGQEFKWSRSVCVTNEFQVPPLSG